MVVFIHGILPDNWVEKARELYGMEDSRSAYEPEEVVAALEPGCDVVAHSKGTEHLMRALESGAALPRVAYLFGSSLPHDYPFETFPSVRFRVYCSHGDPVLAAFTGGQALGARGPDVARPNVLVLRDDRLGHESMLSEAALAVVLGLGEDAPWPIAS